MMARGNEQAFPTQAVFLPSEASVVRVKGENRELRSVSAPLQIPSLDKSCILLT